MNATRLFSARAAISGDAKAMVDLSGGTPRTLTFAGLEEAIHATAGRLVASGLQPGDAVLVLQPMSLELYIALLALLRQGMVAMFVDPSSGRAHLEDCCRMNPPKAFIGSPKAHLLRLVTGSLRKIPVKFHTTRWVPGSESLVAWRTGGPAVPCYEGPSEMPALVRFTSGSTGKPKAAVRTHGFLEAQLLVIESSLNLVAGEVDLATMPLFVLANLAVGVTSVIPKANLQSPGKIDPQAVVTQIRSYVPDRITASPAFLERLADYCASQDLELASFRWIFTGGAPVFPRLLRKLQAMAPAATPVAVYGSTEAEPIAKITPQDITAEDWSAMGSGAGLLAGLPVPEIALRIIRPEALVPGEPILDSAFTGIHQPPGEAGEIVVSGAHVQPGYLHGEGDAETKFRAGEVIWHRTRDAGRLDAQGRLWLLGRLGAVVRDERGVLYPFEVEAAAMSKPEVRRAALVCHEGRRILVLEMNSPGAPPPAMETFSWAGLDQIKVVAELPVDKRHNSKIDYVRLRETLK